MKQKDAYRRLIAEYLSKCNCCDECFAEGFCIQNQLKYSREQDASCPEKIELYFRNLKGE